MSRQKEKNLTQKDRDIIRYFLSNGNTPSIQKQIAEGANVSENHLGGYGNKNGKKKEGGRLSYLLKKGILDQKSGKIHRKGLTNFYCLKENLNAFKQIAEIFLNSDDTLMFMNSEYTQSVMIKYVFNEASKNFCVDLSQDGKVEDLIKGILTKSPSALEYVLIERSKEEIDEKKSLFGKFLFKRSRGNEIDTLAFFSILFYADIVKYSGLAQTAEDIRRGIDSFKIDLLLEESRRLNEEFIKKLEKG